MTQAENEKAGYEGKCIETIHQHAVAERLDYINEKYEK